MKKQEVDHVLRAAGRITGEKHFIIVGSQSLHGKHPDLPDQLVRSSEVDLIAFKNLERTEWLIAIGYESPFHQSFGYYADPVDFTTATLPSGWKDRLIRLPPGDTEGVEALCLDPHDLAIAKYVASREKDRIFTRELARRGIIAQDKLFELLDQTALDQDVREHVRERIEADFSIAKSVSKENKPVIGETKAAAASPRGVVDAGDEMDKLRAQGRENWLKMRRQKIAESQAEKTRPSPDRTRARDLTLDLDADNGKEEEI